MINCWFDRQIGVRAKDVPRQTKGTASWSRETISHLQKSKQNSIFLIKIQIKKQVFTVWKTTFWRETRF